MPEKDTIRVMVVDDHMVVRSGLKAVLQAYEDLEFAGEACNGEEALVMCGKVQPDIVLMDLVMPGMNGAAAIKEILEQFPRVRVIALTSFKEKDLMESAIKAGAIGYLLKNVSADELAEAIREAVAGHSSLSPEAAQALVEGIKQPDEKKYNLTRRETEIITMIIRGMSNNEIATQLVLSRSTVKFHVSNILSKLHVSSRTEAVAVAIKNNLST
ncbi:MAG: response regulator transcription factor [Dehalococcoidales bacterium]|nr:response regulator transcription factor [Dehalococcoidales bacterium]